MIRTHVILAVTKRNFSSYFSGVLGYLFILVFCVASSVMAFNTQFFADNQANLDQLSQQFPLLLLFLIPAITMTVWADEKKLGTDELLFTLPASELEVLIGKYLAVLGVYSVALLFSLAAVALLWIAGLKGWNAMAHGVDGESGLRIVEADGTLSEYVTGTPQAHDDTFEMNQLEYGLGMQSLLAQKRNAFRPRFWSLLRDLLRFYREAPAVLDRP